MLTQVSREVSVAKTIIYLISLPLISFPRKQTNQNPGGGFTKWDELHRRDKYTQVVQGMDSSVSCGLRRSCLQRQEEHSY